MKKVSTVPRFKTAAAVAGLGALIACASPSRFSEAKRELLSDPTNFDHLASGPYESSTKAGETGAVAPVPTFEADAVRAPTVPATKNDEDLQTPDAAYAALLRGNERFVTGAVRGGHRDLQRRRSLASGQKPHTIVLSCSDSRVPPELIFDQGLGDIFSIRVAGNILGSAQVASIEYAIEHLGAKLIVVMGHESCGAVKAAVGSSDAHGGKPASAGSPDLDWLVSSIRPNIQGPVAIRGLASVGLEASLDPKLRKPVMKNVDAVTDQLLIRSKLISEAIENGGLKVVRGIYSLETGRVDFWGFK